MRSALRGSRKRKSITARLRDLKSSRYLVAVAFILALLMGTSGTLMLLTDETPVATNVMTAGKAEVSLWETVQTPDGKDTTKKAIVADETVSLGSIIPNQTVTKAPFVVNEGNVDVYVFVELTFSTKSTAKNVDTPSTTAAFYADFINGLNVKDDSWTSAGVIDTTTPGKVHFGYFYAKGSSPSDLKRVDKDPSTPTAPVFDKITIPDYWTNAQMDDVTYNLEVKAYAIQADYVGPFATGNIGAWKRVFAEQFTDLTWLSPGTP